jgi:hypothetical protein
MITRGMVVALRANRGAQERPHGTATGMNRPNTTEPVVPAASVLCPYCKRPLKWRPRVQFMRGLFECEVCGSFPDYREQSGGREP